MSIFSSWFGKKPDLFDNDLAAQQAAIKVTKPPVAQTIPTVTPLDIEVVKQVNAAPAVEVPPASTEAAPTVEKKPVGKLVASGAAIVAAAAGIAYFKPDLASQIAQPTPPAVTTPAPVAEAPKPVEPTPQPKIELPALPPVPQTVAGETIDHECTAPIAQKKTVRVIYVRVPQTNDKGQVEYVYIKKPVVVYKYVPQPKPIDPVSTPVAVSPPAPVSPAPEPTKPAIVADKGILVGYKGLGGIFDKEAFEEFAKSMGYTKTLVIDSWDQKEAVNLTVDALKDFKTPYGLYGFSLGGDSAKLMVKTVKAMQAKNKTAVLPNAVYVIGSSQVISFKDAFADIPEVMFWFHANTKHDVDGTYIKAPHTGAGNIQQLVADSIKKG